MQNNTIEFDIVIIGAGPAGLSAAIRLKQLCPELTVCILEKGAETGAHILSGAALDPRALNELLPDWKTRNAPVTTAVKHDEFILLTQHHAFNLPVPAPMQNQGNYIISLGNLCRWLAEQAQNAGVEIFTGFAATDVITNDNNAVVGILTGAQGIDKQGAPKENHQPGIAIYAKQIILAEGCRGSVTKQVICKYSLDKDSSPQTYGLGIKEIWEVNPDVHQTGKVTHTIGWPLDSNTYGGSFIYHLENNKIAVGFVTGLDYQNPYLNPFEELQRFKTHPAIKPLFINGKRIAYGARSLVEGGLQSLPKLTFPGGLLIGDSAGFLNVPRIKGIHNAMKSGMLAAETIYNSLQNASLQAGIELTDYQTNINHSWIYQELYQVRNIRPAFQRGLWFGLAYSAIDTYILRGRAPWTFKNHADYQQLKPASAYQPINYPKPDNQITFDKLTSLHLTNVYHEEDQPVHLQLKNPSAAIDINLTQFAAPEQRYCPANVYEIVQREGKPSLQINASNCIHCKACDIKDPSQNINWTPPEGGGGPNYSQM